MQNKDIQDSISMENALYYDLTELLVFQLGEPETVQSGQSKIINITKQIEHLKNIYATRKEQIQNEITSMTAELELEYEKVYIEKYQKVLAMWSVAIRVLPDIKEDIDTRYKELISSMKEKYVELMQVVYESSNRLLESIVSEDITLRSLESRISKLKSELLTPLMRAIESNSLYDVIKLLDDGADPKQISEDYPGHMITTLYLAVDTAIKKLLSTNVIEAVLYCDKMDHEAIDAHPGECKTALRHASESGRTDIVGLLLDYGADPDIRSGVDNKTALEAACANGCIEVVKCLRDRMGRDRGNYLTYGK